MLFQDKMFKVQHTSILLLLFYTLVSCVALVSLTLDVLYLD